MLLFVHMMFIQEPFDSHKWAVDPMRLKPANRGLAEGPIQQGFHRHPLPLPPPTRRKIVCATQAGYDCSH